MEQFLLFPQLPLELQDLIWEKSIPNPARGAIHARLGCQTLHQNEDGSRGGISKIRYHLHYRAPPSETGTRNTHFSALSTLLVTCRRSSAIAIASYNAKQPAEALDLRGLRHPIDALHDLVIFENGWQQECRKPGTRSARLYEPRKLLRSVGVQWPGPRPKGPEGSIHFYQFNALNLFMNIWDTELATIYVAVDPDQLQTARRDWLPEEDRDWDSVSGWEDATLRAFLEVYRQDTARSNRPIFVCGNREYFEVEADELSQLGGLEEVGEFLRVAQLMVSPDAAEDDALEDYVRTRCMVLSWRVGKE